MNLKNQFKWDSRLIEIAAVVATWSKDPSTQVGAVIVDPKNRVLSMGFNGYPRAVKDELHERDEKLRRTIHAETNALLFARGSVEGCTVYVTHPPCAGCAAKLIQSGIKRVVFSTPSAAFSARWLDDMNSAATMFEEAGVVFDCLDDIDE